MAIPATGLRVDTSPRSWLNRLLVAAIILAVSVWLISWAVAALQPLLPFLAIAGFVVGGIYVSAVVIKRRRYW